MRKNLIILPIAIVATGLTSCTKSISREDALKFVDANYKNTEAKKPSKAVVKWDFSKSKGETILLAAKKMIREITYGKSSELTGSIDVEVSYINPIDPLNGDNFSTTFSSSIDYKFALKGKELTVTFENSNVGEIAASQKIEQKFNSYGYICFAKTTSIATVDKDNILNGSAETSFSY